MSTFTSILSWFSIVILSTPLASTEPMHEGRIFLSHDMGVNWERADTGFPPEDGINAMVMHNNKVFAATDAHGIWSLDKSGWHAQSKGLPKKRRIISLLSHHQMLLAGAAQDGLFYSTDDGSTWQAARMSNAQVNVRAITGKGGITFAGTDDGIYKVDVFRGEWQPIVRGLQINAFTHDVKYMYAATQKGILRSADGVQWESIYNGGAIHQISVNKDQIHALDYSGNVFTSFTKDPVFVKQEMFLPRAWLRLTTASPKMLSTEWQQRSILHNPPAHGLPDSVPLNILLQTPFGLLAAGPSRTGC